MKAILFVAAGSGLGGMLRYVLQTVSYKLHQSAFPIGTMLVNILGCLAIGVFYGLFEKGQLLHPGIKLFLITGICGGFTTFSTFSLENISLLRSGHLLYFLLYTTGSVALGLLATVAGIYLVK